jgi:hypothetical protein
MGTLVFGVIVKVVIPFGHAGDASGKPDAVASAPAALTPGRYAFRILTRG